MAVRSGARLRPGVTPTRLLVAGLVAALAAIAAVPAGSSAQDAQDAHGGQDSAAVDASAGGAAAGQPDSASVPGQVRGRVLSAMGRTPLEGAAVTVWNEGAISAAALTDSGGRYRLAGLPPGRHTLSVSIPDHVPHDVDVRIRPGADLELDVVLSIRPPVIAPVHAIGRRPPGRVTALEPRDEEEGPSPGRDADPELRSLESGPGGSLAARALAALDPDPPSSEPAAGLYVRGAASDLKRVYLDGAPVYAPFHLGGLMDALPAGVLGSARLYGAGTPLALDGGLSSVLDLRTRRGGREGFRTAGHVDMLGSAVRVEGGDERAGYLFSGRRAHTGGAEWLIGGDLPYGYHDLLGRVDLRLSDGHRLALTGYANEEGVRLGSPSPASDGEPRARWGNEAGSLRYAADLGSTRALLTVAVGRFSTALPLSSDSAATAPVGETGSVGGPELGSSETSRARIALDFTTPTGGLELHYGAAFDDHRLELVLPEAPALGPAAGARWSGLGRSAAAYAAATIRPTPEFALRGGLRGQLHGDGHGLRVAPRLSAAWRASETTGLEVSAGRFHQRLEAPESALSGDLDAWTELLSEGSGGGAPDPSAFPGLAVASASQLTVRLDHRPAEGLRFGLEGYLKTFDDLAGNGLTAVAPADGAGAVSGPSDGSGGSGDGTAPGDLHASGADLWLDWSSEEWRAWAGYSLAWAWADAPPDSAGSQRFSGRQLVSAGAELPLPGRVRLTGELRASTGLPFTRVPAVPTGETGNSAPDDTDGSPPSGADRGPGLAGSPDGSFLRLDLTLARRWSVELAGRRTALRPYVRFLNALDRRDGLFYHFDPAGGSGARALDTMPLVPVVGLSWELF